MLFVSFFYVRGKGTRPHLITQSTALRPVLKISARVGPSDANVLVTTENGTGKGVIAQALHAVSVRNGKHLFSVKMGLLEEISENSLLNHVCGALTDAKVDRAGHFELADSGTLFTDKIGSIPPSPQGDFVHTVNR